MPILCIYENAMSFLLKYRQTKESLELICVFQCPKEKYHIVVASKSLLGAFMFAKQYDKIICVFLCQTDKT